MLVSNFNYNFAIFDFTLVFKLFVLLLFSNSISNKYLSSDKLACQLINKRKTLFVYLVYYIVRDLIVFYIIVF